MARTLLPGRALWFYLHAGILILGLTLGMTSENGSRPPISFSATFGGFRNDYGNSVQQTSDSGYIIAGSTIPVGATHEYVWLFKTDASGKKLWDRIYGGAGSAEGHSVQQTIDGGYIVAGHYTYRDSRREDVWLIKTDSSGNKLWDMTFGGIGDDEACSVQQTLDGGFVVAGQTISSGAGEYDVWLIKTDASGNRLWDRTFGGAEFDLGRCVQQTSDGGYVVAGFTFSFGAGSADVWLIKTDSMGERIWDKTYGDTNSDYGYSAQQTTDGGYIVAGSTDPERGFSAVWLIKTDALGNKVWEKTLQRSGEDVGRSVRQTSDGGYVITGVTLSDYPDLRRRVWLVKTDSSGNEIWDKTFDAADGGEGSSVAQTLDGGYIITGFVVPNRARGSDVLLIKTDADGN
jgi:hypothetical protein